MPKLTKRTIDALRSHPTGKELFVWDEGDGALKGFGVRVMPLRQSDRDAGRQRGTATYFVQYRNTEGRTRRLVIGRVGVLTPEEARDLASDQLKAATKGADPSADRHAARNAATVAEVCDWYVEEALAGRLLGKGGRKIKATTLAMDKSRIETHVKPLIGRRTVNGLTQADIDDLQADIIAGKSAKGRKGRGGLATGGPGVAARTVGMLRTIFEAARRSAKFKKQVKHNPATGVRKAAGGKHKRFLSLDELTVLGKAMREMADTDNRTGLAAIRALLLTGCRRMEMLALPWEWLDAKGRCIRFDPDLVKSGPLRPIGADAVKHLQAQPRADECKWVFPGEGEGAHFVGLPKVLERVCLKASTKKKGEEKDPPNLVGITVHTLRHTFAAVAAEMGFSELTIAGLLGHSVPGVTARYAHVPDRALVAAADAVSTRIAAALDGRTAEVVDLNEARRG
jgi:integrase